MSPVRFLAAIATHSTIALFSSITSTFHTMSHYGPAATHGRGARASGNNHRHPSMGIGRGSIQMPRHLHRQMMPPPPPPPPPPPRPRGPLPHSQLKVGSGIHKEFMMVRPHGTFMLSVIVLNWKHHDHAILTTALSPLYLVAIT